MNAGSDIERLEVDVSVGIESEGVVICEDDERMGGTRDEEKNQSSAGRL